MKKNYILILFFVAVTTFVYSQQLLVVPNDSAEITANVTDQFEPNDIHIELINNTANSITVTWGLVNYIAPSQWEVKLCDNNNCYDLILGPGPYESLPVAAGDTLDMKFQYTAHLVTGTGATNVYAYVTGDSTNSVVFLNYKANLTYVSGIIENSLYNKLKVSPNPAFHSLVVSGFESADDLAFEIHDIKGARIAIPVKPLSSASVEIETERIPAGDYVVKAFDRMGKLAGVSRFTKAE